MKPQSPTIDPVMPGASEEPGVVSEELAQLQRQLEQASAEVTQAREGERRALADYQNVLRRQREEQTNWAKLATKELLQELIQPLHHLQLAAVQLQDKGLTMVLAQLNQVLAQHGVAEIDALGKTFDPMLMEAVDTKGDGDIVLQVMQPGYLLNGHVIQIAKVVVGTPPQS